MEKNEILELLKTSSVVDLKGWVNSFYNNKIDIQVIYPGLEQEMPEGYQYLTTVIDGFLCWKPISKK